MISKHLFMRSFISKSCYFFLKSNFRLVYYFHFLSRKDNRDWAAFLQPNSFIFEQKGKQFLVISSKLLHNPVQKCFQIRSQLWLPELIINTVTFYNQVRQSYKPTYFQRKYRSFLSRNPLERCTVQTQKQNGL